MATGPELGVLDGHVHFVGATIDVCEELAPGQHRLGWHIGGRPGVEPVLAVLGGKNLVENGGQAFDRRVEHEAPRRIG